MDLDYYTLPQAAQKLNESEDVLLHLIQTKKLKALLYSTNRKFIVISRSRGEYIGHALCWYRGLVSAHESWIFELLEKSTIVVNVAVHLLENDNISNWVKYHDYKGQDDLQQVFADWTPRKNNSADNEQATLAIPYGKEHERVAYQFANMINEIAIPYYEIKNKPISESLKQTSLDKGVRYGYNYQENGTFSLEDLRITHSDLFSIDTALTPSLSRELDKKSNHQLPWYDTQKNPHEFHAALEKLFAENRKLSFKNLLRELEQNTQQYLHPGCTVTIDLNLDWEDKTGKTRTMELVSVEKRISEIRVYYRKNNL
ncbi:MAG: hypothetical protein ACI85E_001621 [Marinomonas primoryensis]|jgi:hypothetical protein